MSEQTIYDGLRAGGLSPAGACAMMGNMACESALRSDNVQDNCPLGDKDYTYNVENGIISKWQFMTDAYGYGLCQWTLGARKCALYEFAKVRGARISDEDMQVQFCINELAGLDEYADLYAYLRTTEDLAKATERICAEYERPAVNNFADRINAAQRYFKQLAAGDCGGDACPIVINQEELVAVEVRVLGRGSLGRDVFLLQNGLKDMQLYSAKLDGDFGPATEAAVKQLQQTMGMELSGVADQAVWQTILQKK